MKSLAIVFALSVAFLPLAAQGAALAQDQATESGSTQDRPGTLRVGVFDSRAVAVAYFASDLFDERMTPIKEEFAKAQASGDQQRIDEIDAQMQAMQQKAHRQGFSTAPVDDILKHVEDQLPEIAKRGGVDLIVSKWAVTYSSKDGLLVDVTDLMVEPFHPDERTLTTIEELLVKPPVPIEDIR